MKAAPPREAALARLFEGLAAAPWRHDFFHTLRRIECLAPEAPRLGRSLRPGTEPVRLGQDPELDFAPAALSSFAPQKHAPPRLGVRFFGLFGPHGPLPLHLTEFARERERHHADPGFARFADLFHHRLLLLFYRAWADAQPAVQADRAAEDRFAAWLGAFAGITPAALKGRDALPDAAKCFHAGPLARGVKNAESLERLLHAWFRVPVQVTSFVGHWLPLRPQDRTRLGGDRHAPIAPRLGTNVVAGSKVWDRQSRFRIRLGPLTLAQYLSFLPGAGAEHALRDWVRQYQGLARAWDVRLVLAAPEVPAARLGSTRLGFTSWLSGPMPRDRDDLVLHPETPHRPLEARHE